MPPWLIALEAGLIVLNAMTPAIAALIQQIITNQGGQPTPAQAFFLYSAWMNVGVKASASN